MATPNPRPHVCRHVANRVRAAGFDVKFVAGWETRGRPYTFSPIVSYRHGTASPAHAANTASLNVVVNGRSGLPGPLSQFYVSGCRPEGGRIPKPVLYVVAAGYANHAGRGVWQVIRNASRGIAPALRAPGSGDVTCNRYAWGTEYEHSNYDAEPIRPPMVELMTVLEAAIGEAEGWTDGGPRFAANHCIDHDEATTRKIDLPETLGDQRGRVAVALGGAGGGGDYRPTLSLTDPYTSGPSVTRVQKRLVELGYDLGRWGADGVFGTTTDTAVKKFQQDRGLTVDGIVGPNTWAALFPDTAPDPDPQPESDQRRYGMLVFAPGKPDAEAVGWCEEYVNVVPGVVTRSKAQAEAAIERGEKVVAIGTDLPGADDVVVAGGDRVETLIKVARLAQAGWKT